LIQDLRFNRLWYYEKIVYSITGGVIKWKTKENQTLSENKLETVNGGLSGMDRIILPIGGKCPRCGGQCTAYAYENHHADREAPKYISVYTCKECNYQWHEEVR